MRVTNVHERRLDVPPPVAGALLDTLSSREDRLWPAGAWPPMRFDGPLEVGARGGHGPIRYTVSAYTPARSVYFVFTGPRGFHGWHGFEVRSLDAHSCLLSHRLEMQARGVARLSWPLCFRWLHDACVEDALTRAEVSLDLTPQVQPWSLRVRLIRWIVSKGRAPPQPDPKG